SVVLRHSESAASGDISEASQRIQSSFIGTPCSVAPGRMRRVRVDGRQRRPDMACWGGQRLYGAFARAPKSAEGGSGRFPPIEWAGKGGRTVKRQNRILPERGCGSERFDWSFCSCVSPDVQPDQGVTRHNCRSAQNMSLRLIGQPDGEKPGRATSRRQRATAGRGSRRLCPCFSVLPKLGSSQESPEQLSSSPPLSTDTCLVKRGSMDVRRWKSESMDDQRVALL